MIHNERLPATRDELLAIRRQHRNVANWHWGKIVLIWGVGAVLVWIGFSALDYQYEWEKNGYAFLLSLILLATLIVTPVALTIITWRWLSAKDKE